MSTASAFNGEMYKVCRPCERTSARPVDLKLRGRTSRSLNSTSVGRKPASVLPPPVGAISSVDRPALAFASKSS